MVYASKRSKSSAQFLVMNDELFYISARMCAHCPKSYRYIITDEILKINSNLHSCIIKANYIYINKYTSRKDYELKLRYWLIAETDLCALEKKINMFLVLVDRGNDFFNNKSDYIEKFADWIRKTKALLKTIKKLKENDKKKYGIILKQQRERIIEDREREEELQKKKVQKKIQKEEEIKEYNRKQIEDCYFPDIPKKPKKNTNLPNI